LTPSTLPTPLPSGRPSPTSRGTSRPPLRARPSLSTSRSTSSVRLRRRPSRVSRLRRVFPSTGRLERCVVHSFVHAADADEVRISQVYGRAQNLALRRTSAPRPTSATARPKNLRASRTSRSSRTTSPGPNRRRWDPSLLSDAGLTSPSSSWSCTTRVLSTRMRLLSLSLERE
jgi:hypothetical protein